MRAMRDYYFDCVIRGNGPQVLYWSRLAAQHGTAEDKKVLVGAEATFGSQ
jgi:hypothetical protein